MSKTAQRLFIIFGVLSSSLLIALQIRYINTWTKISNEAEIIAHQNNSDTVLGEETHLPPISKYVTVSTTIGVPILTLFGYGPTYANVYLNGIGVSDHTLADSEGYYEFKNIFLPVDQLEIVNKKYVYPEICLIAKDTNGLTTQPTCIPPLPGGYSEYEIGPVLLSPTLSLEKAEGSKDETIKASGTITPDTNVGVYFAKEGGSNIFELVKTVSAYYIPTYETKSDSNGSFEFNLPTDNPEKWKIFVASNFKGDNSPKSNTLNFKVMPWYWLIIQFLSALFAFLKPYLYWLLILAEILFLVVLFTRVRKVKNTPERKN